MKELAVIVLLSLPSSICFLGVIYIMSLGITAGWGGG